MGPGSLRGSSGAVRRGRVDKLAVDKLAASCHHACLTLPHPPHPPTHPPAQNLLSKILSRDDSPQFQERVEQFADSFAKRAASETKLVLGGTGLNTSPAAEETAEPIRAGVSLAEEFGQLALRSLRTFAREPLTLRVRLGQAIIIGLLISLFFFDVGGYVVDIKNRLGALFIAVTAQILPNVFGLVLTCKARRERGRGVFGCVGGRTGQGKETIVAGACKAQGGCSSVAHPQLARPPTRRVRQFRWSGPSSCASRTTACTASTPTTRPKCLGA